MLYCIGIQLVQQHQCVFELGLSSLLLLIGAPDHVVMDPSFLSEDSIDRCFLTDPKVPCESGHENGADRLAAY